MSIKFELDHGMCLHTRQYTYAKILLFCQSQFSMYPPICTNACIEHDMQYNSQDIKELELLNFVRQAFGMVAFKF